MQKLYCYVDETGQDTKGEFFIVSVVVTAKEQKQLLEVLEKIEKTSGKGKVKWHQTRDKAKLFYIRELLNHPLFRNKFYFSTYHETKDYLPLTVITVARTVTAVIRGDYEAIVLVDGLPKSRVRWFGTELRHLHIKTEKVRGVRKEEADAGMRLADAICGFVRAALFGSNQDLKLLFEKAEKDRYVIQL